MQMVGHRKKILLSYRISEIANFFYIDFFRKCSMFCRSTPLKMKGAFKMK